MRKVNTIVSSSCTLMSISCSTKENKVSLTSGRSDSIMECVLHSFVAENEPDQIWIYETLRSNLPDLTEGSDVDATNVFNWDFLQDATLTADFAMMGFLLKYNIVCQGWGDHAVPPPSMNLYGPPQYKSDIEETHDKSSDSETYASCDSSLKTQTKDFPPTVDIKTLPESDVEDQIPLLAVYRNRPAVNSADRPNPADWSKRPATVSAGRPVCWVSITNPHNKTPYQLLSGKVPQIGHLKPFGCQVTILNTSDHLGKFEGKADEGYLLVYAPNSKAYRVILALKLDTPAGFRLALISAGVVSAGKTSSAGNVPTASLISLHFLQDKIDLKNKRDARGIVLKENNSKVGLPGTDRQEDGIDYDSVFPQYPIRSNHTFIGFCFYIGLSGISAGCKSAFPMREIGRRSYVKDMLTKFDKVESVRTATTPYEAAKTKLKDETDPPVMYILEPEIHTGGCQFSRQTVKFHVNAKQTIWLLLLQSRSKLPTAKLCAQVVNTAAQVVILSASTMVFSSRTMILLVVIFPLDAYLCGSMDYLLIPFICCGQTSAVEFHFSDRGEKEEKDGSLILLVGWSLPLVTWFLLVVSIPAGVTMYLLPE
ncbi:hypothetical protein Tco_0823307 [Tanacetum coccineum]|uniref:Uncharacterized protein n=1 Tax=Tanacetum coccineum TaxID=301880 RepID=A0ABQ5AII0_9ASTR